MIAVFFHTRNSFDYMYINYVAVCAYKMHIHNGTHIVSLTMEVKYHHITREKISRPKLCKPLSNKFHG